MTVIPMKAAAAARSLVARLIFQDFTFSAARGALLASTRKASSCSYSNSALSLVLREIRTDAIVALYT